MSRDCYEDTTDHIGCVTLFLGGWETQPFGANLTAFLIWLLSLVIYCLQISYQAFSVPDLALVAV